MGTSAFLNDPKLVISIGIATPKCQFSAPKIGTLRVLVGAADLAQPTPKFPVKIPMTILPYTKFRDLTGASGDTPEGGVPSPGSL